MWRNGEYRDNQEYSWHIVAGAKFNNLVDMAFARTNKKRPLARPFYTEQSVFTQ
jgi:hypothetical protein